MDQFPEKKVNKNIEKYLSFASLILGVISLGGNLSMILMFELSFGGLLPEVDRSILWIEIIESFGWFVFIFYQLLGKIFFGDKFLIGLVFPFIIPILGIILGFLSRKRKLAQLGIILNLIGLISAFKLFYVVAHISW